jgi:hypothetical protein
MRGMSIAHVASGVVVDETQTGYVEAERTWHLLRIGQYRVYVVVRSHFEDLVAYILFNG